MSSKCIENTAKFKLTDNNKSSIDKIIIKIFLRFKIIPTKPMEKTVQVSFKIKFVLMYNIKQVYWDLNPTLLD